MKKTTNDMGPCRLRRSFDLVWSIFQKRSFVYSKHGELRIDNPGRAYRSKACGITTNNIADNNNAH